MNVIKLLSPEALETFAAQPANNSRHSDFKIGKFVRLGGSIVVGMTVASSMEEDTAPSAVRHTDLFDYLRSNEPEAYDEAYAQRNSEQLLCAEVHDAGAVTFYLMEDPPRLVMDSESIFYKRADEDGRQRTLHLASQLVGESIIIAGEDLV